MVAMFKNSLIDCMKHPVARWVSIGQMLRYSVPYYFLPAYFLGQFPQYASQFGYYNGVINIVGGMTSSLLGGILSDFLTRKGRSG